MNARLLASALALGGLSCGYLAQTQWADTASSCATYRADCNEKCADERAHSQIGPACASLAVYYVEEHKDALVAESDKSLADLALRTQLACGHEFERGCAANRLVADATAAKATGATTTDAPAPTAAAPAPGTPFNMAEAKSQLLAGATAAESCRTSDGPTGSGRIVVGFAPSGAVQSAKVSGPPFEGTRTGACVEARFRAVRVPAFSGTPFFTSKTFSINTAPPPTPTTPSSTPAPANPSWNPACEPVLFSRANGFSGTANDPKVTVLGDLNGDGQSAFVLDVWDLYRNHNIHVLEPQPAPTCFREVLAGSNLTITVASTKTLGWTDLNINALIPGVNHGGQMTPDHNMSFVARYDGQKYVLQ